MTELLLILNLTDQDMTIVDEIHVLIVHHTYLLIDHHKDEVHVLDLDHVHTLEIDQFNNILRHLDLRPNHESLDLSDPDQVLKQKLKPIPFEENNQFHLLILKSICTILQEWLTLQHLQNCFTHYTCILLKDTMIMIILQD